MIAVTNEQGALLKFLNSTTSNEVIGFHSLFGFLNESQLQHRLALREKKGLKNSRGKWLFKFSAASNQFQALHDCQIKKNQSHWTLSTPMGQFQLQFQPSETPYALANAETHSSFIDDKHKKSWIALGLIFLLFMTWSLLYKKTEVLKEETPEPVTVLVQPEKTVVVPKLEYAMDKEISPQKIQDQKVRRAIQQDLGFLGLLGKKNLKNAVGGMPTDLKDVSPGAGPGGKEGSGGEVLVGLGQGVKRITVGNTGMAGLGGIGTKGAGGGAGGYGNSMVGSGEGKGLTTIPISQDLVLEGGLDKSVIQATIAKYLSQVRACYEEGLKNQPGLSGLVTTDFEINGTGKLNFSKIYKSSLGNPQVEGCITQKMMSWEFPKPRGGVSVKVKYPFLLRPVGG